MEHYQAEFADRKIYRYTQFCEHYKAFTKRLKLSMGQIHRAGEKLFVDFAGPALPLKPRIQRRCGSYLHQLLLTCSVFE